MKINIDTIAKVITEDPNIINELNYKQMMAGAALAAGAASPTYAQDQTQPAANVRSVESGASQINLRPVEREINEIMNKPKNERFISREEADSLLELAERNPEAAMRKLESMIVSREKELDRCVDQKQPMTREYLAKYYDSLKVSHSLYTALGYYALAKKLYQNYELKYEPYFQAQHFTVRQR